MSFVGRNSWQPEHLHSVSARHKEYCYMLFGGSTVMTSTRKFAGSIAAACLALAASSGAALAQDKFEWSANIGGTSDYVFRGYSQTLEDPALQGGLDASYGIFYIGVWGSGVDFVQGSGGRNSGDASVEIDVYAGITPKLGPVNFDLGVIYYAYPGADDADGSELDYVELKVGASGEFIKSLSTGITYYYSPEYTGEVGDTHFIELNAGYEFQQVGIFTPSLSGLVGWGIYDNDSTLDYTYWNAGLTLAVENFSLDFRYWDTDVANNGLADERFVFTASVSVP